MGVLRWIQGRSDPLEELHLRKANAELDLSSSNCSAKYLYDADRDAVHGSCLHTLHKPCTSYLLHSSNLGVRLKHPFLLDSLDHAA